MIEKRNVSLNLNIRGLGQSATLEIQDRVRAMRGDGRTIYNLGLGQSPFPIPAPVVDCLKLNASKHDYLPVSGLPQLRQAVAEYHRKKEGLEIDPRHVLVGPGSKELLFLLQLCYYGEIVVPTPCWVSYTPQARIIGRKVRLIKTSIENDWKVQPEQIVKLFEGDKDRYRPRLFVLNYPGNPTGVTYSADELKAIAEVAREYEVIILSDEIYNGLHYSGEHVSLARFYPEGTILATGISKWASAGGWRLGTFTFPKELEWLHEAMAAVASETYTSVSTPIQYAAVKAYQGGQTIERYLMHLRRILRDLGGRCHKTLTDAGIRCAAPDGAYYLFPDFSPHRDRLQARGIETSQDLCNKLLEDTGVAMLPGVAFERPEEELTARMAFVDFDGAEALAVSESIALDKPLPDGFLESRCGRVLEGMEQVARWVED